MDTHPSHGRPEAMRQTPQATQVPLETAQLKGRGLGSIARTLRGLGWCRQLLPPPQASAHHKEQVTQEQLHGLGVMGRGHGGSSSSQRVRVGGPTVPGAGSGLHCRGTAPASHTCNATAMHHGAARLSRPPCPPPATEAASKEGPSTPLTPPLLQGVGKLKPDGGNHSPLDPSLSQKQGQLGPQYCTILSG